jgi:hypothetical protein
MEYHGLAISIISALATYEGMPIAGLEPARPFEAFARDVPTACLDRASVPSYRRIMA